MHQRVLLYAKNQPNHNDVLFAITVQCLDHIYQLLVWQAMWHSRGQFVCLLHIFKLQHRGIVQSVCMWSNTTSGYTSQHLWEQFMYCMRVALSCCMVRHTWYAPNLQGLHRHQCERQCPDEPKNLRMSLPHPQSTHTPNPNHRKRGHSPRGLQN